MWEIFSYLSKNKTIDIAKIELSMHGLDGDCMDMDMDKNKI